MLKINQKHLWCCCWLGWLFSVAVFEPKRTIMWWKKNPSSNSAKMLMLWFYNLKPTHCPIQTIIHLPKSFICVGLRYKRSTVHQEVKIKNKARREGKVQAATPIHLSVSISRLSQTVTKPPGTPWSLARDPTKHQYSISPIRADSLHVDRSQPIPPISSCEHLCG